MEIKGRSLVGIAWLRLGVSSVCSASAEFNSVWRVLQTYPSILRGKIDPHQLLLTFHAKNFRLV
jgi:hypothetical protein